MAHNSPHHAPAAAPMASAPTHAALRHGILAANVPTMPPGAFGGLGQIQARPAQQAQMAAMRDAAMPPAANASLSVESAQSIQRAQQAEAENQALRAELQELRTINNNRTRAAGPPPPAAFSTPQQLKQLRLETLKQSRDQAEREIQQLECQLEVRPAAIRPASASQASPWPACPSFGVPNGCCSGLYGANLAEQPPRLDF